MECFFFNIFGKSNGKNINIYVKRRMVANVSIGDAAMSILFDSKCIKIVKGMANTKIQINQRSWVAALSSASMRSMSARMDGDIAEGARRGAAGVAGAEAACCPWTPSLTEWNEAALDGPRREDEPRRMDSGWVSSS